MILGDVVIDAGVLHANGGLVLVLKDVVVSSAGNVTIEKISGGKDTEQRNAACIQPVGRDYVAWKDESVGGVSDGDDASVQIERLAEVAASFLRGGHGKLRDGLWHCQRPELLRPEEEHFVAIAIELGEHDGTADVVVPSVVAVARLCRGQAVIEEIVGIELLVSLEIGSESVELLRP